MSDPRHGILLFLYRRHFGRLIRPYSFPSATDVLFEHQAGVETPSETDFVTI